MNYDFGDVVLVPFPFSNQQAYKKRPAVVISNVVYHQEKQDIIILAITSQLKLMPLYGEFVLQDWHQAGLIKPSVCKPVITTIEQRLVLKKMGLFSANDRAALKSLLSLVISERTTEK